MHPRKVLARSADAPRPLAAALSLGGTVLRRWGTSAVAGVLSALSVLASPPVVLLLLLLGACVLLVAGVNVLAGFGWALIAAAGAMFALALFLAVGLNRG